MPSIMDIFSQTLQTPGTPPVQVPPGGSPMLQGATGNNGQVPPQGTQQQGTQPPTNGGTPPNGTNPPTNTPSGTEEPASPLDKFSTLWQPPKQDSQPAPPSFGEVDPAKIQELASKMDFSRFIPADTLSKIQAGGDEAAKAFQTAMQALGTGVFSQNTLVTTKLIDQALKQQQEQFRSQLPTLVKQHTLGESLAESNPVLNHPAAKPLIDSLQVALARQFPEASSAQLAKYAQEYLTSFAKDITKTNSPGDSKEDNKNAGKEPDWSSFLPDYMK